jgi:hypothetical protein
MLIVIEKCEKVKKKKKKMIVAHYRGIASSFPNKTIVWWFK